MTPTKPSPQAPIPTDPAQPVIPPTIGRRVWYWPCQWDTHKTSDYMVSTSATQAMDAGVCFVHSAGLVNLLVTDHGGAVHARTRVRLLQGGEQPMPGEAHAQWMPYQASQAGKGPDVLNGETANVLKSLGRSILELVAEVRELRKLAQAAGKDA